MKIYSAKAKDLTGRYKQVAVVEARNEQEAKTAITAKLTAERRRLILKFWIADGKKVEEL